MQTGREIYYGWWIVAACFTCFIFVFAIPTFTFPLIYGPMMDENPDWTRTQVTAVSSVKFFTSAIVCLFAGFIIDKFGARITTMLACALSGVALICFLWVDVLPELYAIAVLIGISAVFITVSLKVLISRWFQKNMGLALGIATLGTSVAGIFGPPISQFLIASLGWRATMATLSIGSLLFAIPLIFFIVKDSPAKAGVSTQGEFDTDPGGRIGADVANWTISQILRSRTFWCAALAVYLAALIDQGMLQHTALFIERDVGLGTNVAVMTLSLIALTSAVGKIFFGVVFDRFSIRGIIMCYLTLGLSCLIAFTIHSGLMVAVFLFALARGLAHGGNIIDVPVISKHCFGPHTLGRTIGFFAVAMNLGFGTGPLLAGWIYDRQGDYSAVFITFTGLSIIAVTALFFVKPRYRDYLKEQALKSPSNTDKSALRN